MGGTLSDDGWTAQTQQQRAQLLLLSQLREGRATEAGEGSETLSEGWPVVRPTAQPGLWQTQVYKNPLHVKGRSIRLERSGEDGGPTKWQVSFSFDALVACEVVVHVGVEDSGAEEPPRTAAWSSQPQVFVEASLGQECRAEVDMRSFQPAPPWQAAVRIGDPVTTTSSISFCIELRAPQGGAAEWTMGSFVHRSGYSPEVQFTAQRVRLPGGHTTCYETREVFGAEVRGPAVLGQDCVICMSERRDTAVLPCRHMCLCGSCAETMRSRVQYRSYRCPICRERVSSLMQIQSVPESAREQEGSRSTEALPMEASP